MDASFLSNLWSLDCAATLCDGDGRKRQNAHIADFPRPGYIHTQPMVESNPVGLRGVLERGWISA